ncbi:acetyltransferase, GNAT family [Dictyocaulus viviparus]|uniref:Acetyltransferase, GNAT family n=1 Tax=Dictyocaulus viviparus TaxID=29172 RepID=A0A0D8XGX8_DICVI|nr:acetyltransferase, GNAT family [Dictyocaulus viviparus]
MDFENMTTEYEIVDSLDPDDRIWLQWKSLVENEGWKSDDLSVLTLTPRLPSTRIVLARKKKDASYIGSVVWNEYDNIAFIGFYLILPAYRGQGVGSVIWERAIERVPRNYTIVLRGVPKMVPRYKSQDTPVEGATLHSYEVDEQTILKVKDLQADINCTIKKVSELTALEYRELEQFDLSIVKRDRKDFLRRFYNLPFTTGIVLFNNNNEIVATAASCPTSHPDLHLYKLAPLYASSTQEASIVLKTLVAEVKKVDTEARFVIQVLTGSVGFKFFTSLFTSMNVLSEVCGVTLFSRTFANPIDNERLFIPHNNSCHFDA